MSEHWHQQLSRASEGFGSVSVSRSYLRSALDRILELETALADARREKDAMKAVVEAASDYADMLLRYEHGDDVSDHNDGLIEAVRAHRVRAKEGMADA